MTADKLHQAIQLINSGNKQEALPLLKELVQANPINEKAWLWLSVCVDEVEQKKYCLRQALRINPTNNNANLALLKLENLKTSPSLKPVETQGLLPAVSSQKWQSPKKNGVEVAKAVGSRTSLMQLGGLTFLLIILLGIVLFGGSWVYKGLASPEQLAPAMGVSQAANTSSPKNEILYSITPTSSLFSPAPLRPSFTPYPTNTSFVISTWTPTKIPPTLTFTAVPYQSPTQMSTDNPKSIKQTKEAGGGGADSPPPEPPVTSISDESPYDIPTGNVVPTKTQKSNYTLNCGVSPKIIQVGTNTTLMVSAQMYVDGSATTTVALVAEWQDSQGRNFQCTSSGSSCQGQSGYFSGNDKSTIKIGASASDGTRRTCQTTFGTN